MTHPDQPQHPGAPGQPPQPGYGQSPQPGYPQPQVPQQPGYAQPQVPPQFPPGYPQQAYAPYPAPPARKSKTGLIIGIVVGSIAVLAGIVVALMVLLGAFTASDPESTEGTGPTPSASPEVAATVQPTPQPVVEPTEEPIIDDSELDLSPRDPATPFPDTTVDWQPGSAEAFAARDQFFIDQRLPMDGSQLTATTVEQRTFIARQREYFEQNGVELTPQIEAIYLAMTSDACETAIMNAHAVDAAAYDAFIVTSPLYTELLGDLAGDERAAASRNLEEVMLFGMSYVCSGDVNEWALIFEERYGEFPGIY